jgi:hypothetical protein
MYETTTYQLLLFLNSVTDTEANCKYVSHLIKIQS